MQSTSRDFFTAWDINARFNPGPAWGLKELKSALLAQYDGLPAGWRTAAKPKSKDKDKDDTKPREPREPKYGNKLDPSTFEVCTFCEIPRAHKSVDCSRNPNNKDKPKNLFARSGLPAQTRVCSGTLSASIVQLFPLAHTLVIEDMQLGSLEAQFTDLPYLAGMVEHFALDEDTSMRDAPSSKDAAPLELASLPRV